VHGDLAGLLLSAARDNAARALTLYVSTDRLELLQSAVALGTAIELAAKAFLASIEPTLLSERGDADTILCLSGKPSLAGGTPTTIRTLGGIAACRLARKLGRAVVAGDSDVQRALEVRNSAAHMALVDKDELRSCVPAMARIVDSLVAEMGEDRAAFWANQLSLADQLIEARVKQVTQILEAKKTAAIARLAELTRYLNDTSRPIVLASLSRLSVHSDHEEAHTCPICDQRAWLICSVEDSDPQSDGLDVWLPQTAWPFEFICSVCGLHLEGDEELAAMGLDFGIELDPRDMDETDYEPPDRVEEE